MDRHNYLLKPRYLKPVAARRQAEKMLKSVNWWYNRNLDMVEAREEPWRSELELDGSETPEEDFEDGLNVSGVVYRQLRNWNNGENEPALEWEPNDYLDLIEMLREGEIVFEEEERKSRRYLDMRPMTYVKIIDGAEVTNQQSDEIWWGRAIKGLDGRGGATMAHLVATVRDIKESAGSHVYRVRMSAQWRCNSKSQNVYIWQGPIGEDACQLCRKVYETLQEKTEEHARD